MKLPAVLILLAIGLCSFYQINSLAGRWEYAGDIFHGKRKPRQLIILYCENTPILILKPS
jgi:hypothetical protein